MFRTHERWKLPLPFRSTPITENQSECNPLSGQPNQRVQEIAAILRKISPGTLAPVSPEEPSSGYDPF